MSDLVGNPEDRFSQNEAHLEKVTCALNRQVKHSFCAHKNIHNPNKLVINMAQYIIFFYFTYIQVYKYGSNLLLDVHQPF